MTPAPYERIAIVTGATSGIGEAVARAFVGRKFAVHAMTEALRRDLGPQGVRVSLVEPGFVLSGFQAAAGYSDSMVRGFQEKCGPLLTGADVADAILYMITRPPHVHVGDLVIRPVRQDYP